MNKDQAHFNKFVETLEIFFPRKEVLFVFEMGAKDCADTLKFSEKFPQAKIFTFECNSQTLPLCRAAVAGKKNITLTETAVSNIDGNIKFFPIDTDKTVTVHKDGNPGASSMFKASGKYPLEQYVQKETIVPSTRLDTFMRKNDIPGIDILWLDTQGAELKILEGLGDKLQTVRLIHTEIEFMDIYSGQPLWKDVKKMLKRKGFIFVGFARRGQYFGDAIFVNKCVRGRLGMIKRIAKIRWADIVRRIRYHL